MDKAQDLIKLLKIAKLETLEECLEMIEETRSAGTILKEWDYGFDELYYQKLRASLQQKILQIKGQK